jgi:2,4-dienoyl-CoA reductase-like NADH-dependent reductase (Old Yellow Enzyme family)/thioredoxin reductase
MASNYTNCFTPITIRGVTYKNRIEVSPHVPAYGACDGTVTPEVEAFFHAYARGGAGLINMGNCSIDMTEAKDEVMQIDLSRDETILGLSHLRESCERYGAVLSLEINHCGRGAGKYYPSNKRYGPSNIPLPDEAQRYREAGLKVPVVIEMTTDKIYETIGKYAEAASRCRRGGFQHLLIHGAHGNLITQFMSPMSNKRNDNYGGSLRNRARFAVEVMRAVRETVGEEVVLEMRVSPEDGLPEGVPCTELIEICKLLEDYVDIFIVSYGMMGMPHIINKMMADTYSPPMHNLEYIKQFKSSLKRARISAVGTLQNLDNCEMILQNGWADFTAMCRPFMADPDLARKGARNRADQIRPCLRCNYHGRVAAWYSIGCAVNPFCGREHAFPDGRVPRTQHPKKVMIVGGGLSGLQAAWTGTEMGHHITVYEKTDKLGGNFNHAGVLPFKQDARNFYDYFMPKAANCGAKFVMNTAVTPELIKRENPDVVIVAAGAEHVLPDIPGCAKPNVHFSYLADSGKVPVGKRVAVIGAGVVGLESALQLARDGHQVTVLEYQDIGSIKDMNARIQLPRLLALEPGTTSIYHVIVEEICDNKVICRDRKTCKTFEVPCDTVLIAAGLRPRREVYDALLHNDTVSECDIFMIGDVKSPRQIGHAVNEAFDLITHI